MKMAIIFRWYDAHVGFYWDRKDRSLYVFPIPMLGVRLSFGDRCRMERRLDDMLAAHGAGQVGERRKVVDFLYVKGADQLAWAVVQEEHLSPTRGAN